MAQRIVDWDELYPGRFFKAGLIAEGQRPVFTVSAVDVEPLEGENGTKDKGILSFQGEKLQFPLNKTNGICLREMFGRVPYKWVGHKFALFQTEWAGEPCLRIWGSPELTEDKSVTIQLPKRKPFTMVMHAMQAPKLVGKGRKSEPPPAPVDSVKPKNTPECAQLLRDMVEAQTVEQVMDIEADVSLREFDERETDLLERALARRKKQIADAEDALNKAGQQ